MGKILEVLSHFSMQDVMNMGIDMVVGKAGEEIVVVAAEG